MQTLPAAAVFGLLPIPSAPANVLGGSGARSAATESLDASRHLYEQPLPSALADHLKILRDVLKGRSIDRL
jgi:hypothetical protein